MKKIINLVLVTILIITGLIHSPIRVEAKNIKKKKQAINFCQSPEDSYVTGQLLVTMKSGAMVKNRKKIKSAKEFYKERQDGSVKYLKNKKALKIKALYEANLDKENSTKTKLRNKPSKKEKIRLKRKLKFNHQMRRSLVARTFEIDTNAQDCKQLEAYAKALLNNKEVETISLNKIMQSRFVGPVQDPPSEPEINPQPISEIPNDEFLAQQLYINQTNIDDAWFVTTGGNVRVGVIDGFIDERHPDLELVDEYNFNHDIRRQEGLSKQYLSNSFDHGTKVSGVLKATANNNIGIAGVAHNADLYFASNIETSQNQEEKKTSTNSQVIAAINYLVDSGVDVINMSFGYYDNRSRDEISQQALYQTIATAIEDGVTIVAASGNENVDVDRHVGEVRKSGQASGALFCTGTEENPCIDYISNIPGVISVGATDSNNTAKASFSNHGSDVDISAPGERIATTVYEYNETHLDNPEYTYVFSNGTSFSAPIVAGAAALVYSVLPEASAADVRNLLVDNSTRLSNSITSIGGTLNIQAVFNYLEALPAPIQLLPSSTFNEDLNRSPRFTWSRVLGADLYKLTVDGIEILETEELEAQNTGAYPTGTHTWEIQACNRLGCGAMSPLSPFAIKRFSREVNIIKPVVGFATDETEIQLQWSKIDNSVNYDYKIIDLSTNAVAREGSNINRTGSIGENNLEPANYRFEIRACLADECGNYTSREFRVFPASDLNKEAITTEFANSVETVNFNGFRRILLRQYFVSNGTIRGRYLRHFRRSENLVRTIENIINGNSGNEGPLAQILVQTIEYVKLIKGFVNTDSGKARLASLINDIKDIVTVYITDENLKNTYLTRLESYKNFVLVNPFSKMVYERGELFEGVNQININNQEDELAALRAELESPEHDSSNDYAGAGNFSYKAKRELSKLILILERMSINDDLELAVSMLVPHLFRINIETAKAKLCLEKLETNAPELITDNRVNEAIEFLDLWAGRQPYERSIANATSDDISLRSFGIEESNSNFTKLLSSKDTDRAVRETVALSTVACTKDSLTDTVILHKLVTANNGQEAVEKLELKLAHQTACLSSGKSAISKTASFTDLNNDGTNEIVLSYNRSDSSKIDTIVFNLEAEIINSWETANDDKQIADKDFGVSSVDIDEDGKEDLVSFYYQEEDDGIYLKLEHHKLNGEAITEDDEKLLAELPAPKAPVISKSSNNDSLISIELEFNKLADTTKLEILSISENGTESAIDTITENSNQTGFELDISEYQPGDYTIAISHCNEIGCSEKTSHKFTILEEINLDTDLITATYKQRMQSYKYRSYSYKARLVLYKFGSRYKALYERYTQDGIRKFKSNLLQLNDRLKQAGIGTERTIAYNLSSTIYELDVIAESLSDEDRVSLASDLDSLESTVELIITDDTELQKIKELINKAGTGKYELAINTIDYDREAAKRYADSRMQRYETRTLRSHISRLNSGRYDQATAIRYATSYADRAGIYVYILSRTGFYHQITARQASASSIGYYSYQVKIQTKLAELYINHLAESYSKEDLVNNPQYQTALEQLNKIQTWTNDANI